jgi:cytochrome c1
MKKIFIAISIICIFIIAGAGMSGCYLSAKATNKSGAQLWGENCNRCHNAPAPGEFNNDNWDLVGTHMQLRANITKDDMEKIIEFLKSANN